ncbi:hypothetical protein G5597_26010 [Klebsiella pneumoniae]|nr:hypothetical protein [Klebsiella pneumoniae]
MPAFEWVHVQLHQQKGMISLSPPTICNSAPSFSEMNEHERAIVAHSFMNNSASYAHQKMIEEHKKMLSGSDANSKTSSSSFNELNAGEKAALVHEQVNNAGAEAHQTQARKLRGLYSTR